jgi:hypothetical protein
MMRWFRITIIALLAVFLLSTIVSCRRSHRPYNPYLHMKTKPSEEQAKQNKRAMRKGKRAYKDQLGDSRKRLFGRRKPPVQKAP